MNVPIKVIHKFKNSNRRIQYIQYIFIGSNTTESILLILDSIKNKTFYETFDFLSKNKLEQLSTYYGDKWYTYFFNRYHLSEQFNGILKNNNKKQMFETKLGKEWVGYHFGSPLLRRTMYSFASTYYDYLIARNKIKSAVRKVDMDFRTYALEIHGGAELEKENEKDKENIDGDIDAELNKEIEDVMPTVEDFEDEVAEDFNLDELTKLYSTNDIENDKNIQETTRLISEATHDRTFIKQVNKTEIEFNSKLDDIAYDAKLEDVYTKVYIKDQYIFMDDSIRTLRTKIAVSIPLSDKFGEDFKLLPEYMYFWTEYNYNNVLDRVMLGQKWIRRNEMVQIDIKPNDNLHVYENLRNNLSYLKDSFGIKLKREDDEYNILRDYEQFITNNEIYMIDIVNELGLNYDSEAEKKKNIYEVYVNIYYPFISFERFETIVDMLNNKNDKEINLNVSSYGMIRNDTMLEKQIYSIVEETKMNIDKFNTYFRQNYIIQSIIHVNLNNPKNLTGTVSQEKYNLYKIFDNFIVSEEYPFIQYQTPDSQLTYKFYTMTKKIDDVEILSKWFENAPYGISFKIKMKEIKDKYISINLNDVGRLEYKMTWKEEDEATIDTVKQSYQYVNNLLLKINNENKKIKFILPEDENYKYAFINTIQKFALPEKFKINHNDLSDFCRYFYTYIALVIEPRKRLSLTSNDSAKIFSKYGTYLRYKRISNYENKTKMHMRMLYFLRNFEISDKELIDEIAKQFNITQESSAEELDIVRKKYGKVLGKMKKTLLKLKSIPKPKPPGIGIDIQGRTVDNYKIRITGAKSRLQLDEIISFMKILLYLYVEIYITKNPKYLKMKDTLSKLTKIAKRRHKVNDMVDYNSGVSIVKQVTLLDKKRLGFKPEEGQNQWTRSCQNSGDDKKRRPLIVSNNDIKDLLKRGYKLNPKNNTYEKKAVIVEKGVKRETTVRAIKLPGEDGTFNYYTCDPSDNNEHCYIGFLTKSNNPNDLCMPCCFKKDQSESVNTKKRNYYLKCLGQTSVKSSADKPIETVGDKVYILQDTNKIQDGRFIYLPKYLNQLFNTIWKNSYVIKNHYLTESSSGYYFKYTVKDNNFHFLAAIANTYNLTIDDIKNKAVKYIENDTHDRVFTYLNNGDIKSMFKDRDSFIKYISNSNYLEYDIMGELLGLPNVISPKGIFYFIFNKKIKIIKKSLEKDTMVENYYLQCLNYENYYQIENDMDFVILIKDGKYYFPIYNVKKHRDDKKITLTKQYNITSDSMIINELKQYYSMSCIESFIFKINKNYNITAKNIYNLYPQIKKQIIDMRNKVRYLLLDTGLLLPVKPSGTIINIPIQHINTLKQSDLSNLNDMIKMFKKFNQQFPMLSYLPKVINYNAMKDNEYHVISLLLMNNMIVPTKADNLSPNSFKKYGLGYEFQSIEEVIDNVIIENEVPYDTRSISVKNKLFRNETYNLFRLEMSVYLANNTATRASIINIVRGTSDKKLKRKELTRILLDIIENKSKGQGFIEYVKELPKLNDYYIPNVREYCGVNRNADKCNANLHCTFIQNKCMFIMYKNDTMVNIAKIVEEFIMDGIKFKEIIQEDAYYVSDIVDYTQFSDRPNQKIIKTSNFNIKKIMTELFGKESIPQLGRRRIGKHDIIITQDIPEVIELGKQLIQEIVPNKNSVVRAYINSYYWLHNTLYDKESRNLGYESDIQEHLANLFKANLIDYIANNFYNEELKKDIGKYIELNKDMLTKNIFTSAINRFRKNNYNTDGILELIVLSYMFPYPIVVYNNYNAVSNIFSSGPVSVNEKTIARYTHESEQSKTIFIKFDFEGSNKIPQRVYSIYYS